MRSLQRQPQDDQDAGDRNQGIAQRALADDRELFVVQRHPSGEIDPCVESVAKLQVGRGAANDVGRFAARLQCREVEDRLDLEEVAQLLGSRRTPLQQHLPGERRGPVGEDVVKGIGGERERPLQLIDADLFRPHAGGNQRQRSHHAAQARVGGKDPDERLRPRQSGGGFFHVAKRL
jgi:hypothetical protein